jgi:hypothetical protein
MKGTTVIRARGLITQHEEQNLACKPPQHLKRATEDLATDIAQYAP